MHLKYARYVLRHKWFVYQEARKLGVGFVQAVLHDWHKFLPDEWVPYARYFYGGPYRPWAEFSPYLKSVWLSAHKSSKEYVEERFDEAWLKHQHRGAHHWQHWVLPEDDGGTKVLPIPDKYRREMLADWRGMGRAFGEHPPAVGWYEKNKDKMQLHPETRAWIEEHLPYPA